MKKRLLSLTGTLLICTSLGAQSPGFVPPAQQSPNFMKVAQYLDLGGTVYGYMDVDGDISRIAAQVKELLQLVPETEHKGDAAKFAMVKNLNFEAYLSALGFSNVKALGASSYKAGDSFRNKAFILMDGGPQGLFKVGGVAPHKFETWTMAPAGTDFAFEQDMDIHSVYLLISQMAQGMMGDMGKAMIEGALNKPPKPGMPFTLKQVVESLDTRALGIVRFATDKTLQIPLTTPRNPTAGNMEIPLIDFYFSLDNFGWFVDHAISEVEKRQGAQILRVDGWRGFLPPGPMPPFLQGYQPYLLHETATGRMVVVSRPEFMNECLARGRGIQTDPEFHAATQGLPKTGNGFSYMSSDAFKLLTTILRAVASQSSTPPPPPQAAPGGALVPGEPAPEMPAAAKMPPEVAEWVIKTLAPFNRPVASVYRTQEDGALFVANQPFSHKGNLVMGLVPNPLFMAGMFMAKPKRSSGQPEVVAEEYFNLEPGPNPQDMNKLRQIGIAYQQYMQATGGHMPATTAGVHGFAVELALKAGSNDASLYRITSDPLVVEHLGDIAAHVSDKAFPGMPFSYALVVGLPSNAPATSTPIAWTRGLGTNGKWADDAPYGDTGGHILFLDGHVEKFGDVVGKLKDYETGQPTSDIRKAVAPGATILEPDTSSLELEPLEVLPQQ